MPGGSGPLGGLLDVAAALQVAASRCEVSDAYLRSIPSVVGAAGYGLYILDPATLAPVSVAATVPDTFLDLYERQGRMDDPVLAEALETGAPVDSSRLSPKRSWDSSAVAAVLAGAGYYHSLEAPIVVNGTVSGTLNMARAASEQPFSATDLEAVGVVAEQVGLALTRSARFDHLAQDTMTLADALDAAVQPIVITTMDGRLIFSNRMAAKAAPGSPLSYLERARAPLGRTLESLRDSTNRVASAHEIPSDSPAWPLAYTPAIPFTAGVVVTVKSVRLRSRTDAVVSFLSHRHDRGGLPDSANLLSRREREVADMVSRGLTNREIAELAYVSENTVKQHLKRIFTKMQVRSRAQLVQSIWQATAESEQDPKEVTPGYGP